MGKRGQNEGSLIHRADGRWEARISAGIGPDGKRVRRSAYAKTRKEAKAKLDALLAELEAGIDPGLARQPLSVYLPAWLAEKRRSIAPQTATLYHNLLGYHILPVVGGVELGRVTPAHVRAVLRAMEQKGLSASLIADAKVVLGAALEQAVRDEIIPRNPASVVAAPRIVLPEVPILSDTDVERLFAALSGTWNEALLVTALGAGLRVGELVALRWSEVDLDARRLRVAAKAVFKKGQGMQLEPPKTKQSLRSVPLAPFVVDALRRQQQRQADGIAPAGDLVFPSARTGAIQYPATIWCALDRALKKAGLPPMRVHDLRHNCATALMARRVPPRVVQEILGHANVSITLGRYSHVVPSLHEEAANELERAFGGRGGGQGGGQKEMIGAGEEEKPA